MIDDGDCSFDNNFNDGITLIIWRIVFISEREKRKNVDQTKQTLRKITIIGSLLESYNKLLLNRYTKIARTLVFRYNSMSDPYYKFLPSKKEGREYQIFIGNDKNLRKFLAVRMDGKSTKSILKQLEMWVIIIHKKYAFLLTQNFCTVQ